LFAHMDFQPFLFDHVVFQPFLYSWTVCSYGFSTITVYIFLDCLLIWIFNHFVWVFGHGFQTICWVFGHGFQTITFLGCLLIWIFNHFCLIIWCFNHFVLLLTIHTEHCASKLAIPKTVHNKPSSYWGSLALPDGLMMVAEVQPKPHMPELKISMVCRFETGRHS
jgi:hypothetical protein